MRVDGFRYLVRQGWKSMRANKLMTFASVGVLTACLVITGIAALLSLNVNRLVTYLGDQNEIVVYMQPKMTADEQSALETQISSLDNVGKVTFVSSQDALEEMKGWMEEYSGLFDGYEDVLPASFRVQVSDLSRISQTATSLKALNGVESTSVPQDLATAMLALRNAVSYGGWGLVIVLALVALIVISNTIRLTVFSRRREISIMKYVGATNGFIRLPFFVEGMTIGAISGLLAAGVVCGAYFLVTQYISNSTMLWAADMFSQIYTFNQVWPFVAAGFLLLGIFIGSIGTSSSVRKHLKV